MSGKGKYAGAGTFASAGRMATMLLAMAGGMPVAMADPVASPISSDGDSRGAVQSLISLELGDNRCFNAITTHLRLDDFTVHLNTHVTARLRQGPLAEAGYAINPAVPPAPDDNELAKIFITVRCLVDKKDDQLLFSFLPVINRYLAVEEKGEKNFYVEPMELDPVLGVYDNTANDKNRRQFLDDLNRITDSAQQRILNPPAAGTE